ncbi:syncytin-2-like [Saimiri boliviensis]|uniref:syncytin-2-like n=1 Tax=Saimiri boliviensis TaxID=27679 RepID=UPI003D783F49
MDLLFMSILLFSPIMGVQPQYQVFKQIQQLATLTNLTSCYICTSGSLSAEVLPLPLEDIVKVNARVTVATQSEATFPNPAAESLFRTVLAQTIRNIPNLNFTNAPNPVRVFHNLTTEIQFPICFTSHRMNGTFLGSLNNCSYEVVLSWTNQEKHYNSSETKINSYRKPGKHHQFLLLKYPDPRKPQYTSNTNTSNISTGWNTVLINNSSLPLAQALAWGIQRPFLKFHPSLSFHPSSSFHSRLAAQLGVAGTLLWEQVTGTSSSDLDPPLELASWGYKVSLDPGQGLYFICGNSGYLSLPSQWKGTCGIAALLPKLSFVNASTKFPCHASVKRAAPAVLHPLATAVTGLLGTTLGSISLHLSSQQTQALAEITAASQEQQYIDSLAGIVLQKKRRLDLLTANRRGLCISRKEECCFYVNSSGKILGHLTKATNVVTNLRTAENTLNSV